MLWVLICTVHLTLDVFICYNFQNRPFSGKLVHDKCRHFKSHLEYLTGTSHWKINEKVLGFQSRQSYSCKIPGMAEFQIYPDFQIFLITQVILGWTVWDLQNLRDINEIYGSYGENLKRIENWKCIFQFAIKDIVGRVFLTPYFMKIRYIAYPPSFFKFCPTPLPSQSPPSLLSLLPCFFGWIDDRATLDRDFPNSVKGDGGTPREWEILLWDNFFIGWVGIWWEVILTIWTFFKAKNNILWIWNID